MQDSTFWLIVYSGTRGYIGKAACNSPPEKLIECGWVTLKPYYTLIEQVVPRGQGLTGQSLALPPGLLVHLDEAPLHCRIDGFVVVDTLHELDRKKYMDLVENAQKMVDAQRASDAGIRLADPSSLSRLR